MLVHFLVIVVFKISKLFEKFSLIGIRNTNTSIINWDCKHFIFLKNSFSQCLFFEDRSINLNGSLARKLQRIAYQIQDDLLNPILIWEHETWERIMIIKPFVFINNIVKVHFENDSFFFTFYLKNFDNLGNCFSYIKFLNVLLNFCSFSWAQTSRS